MPSSLLWGWKDTSGAHENNVDGTLRSQDLSVRRRVLWLQRGMLRLWRLPWRLI